MTEDLTTPTPDAFEAALAANADDLAAPVEVIAENDELTPLVIAGLVESPRALVPPAPIVTA
jgi:hypothetical protein